MKRRSTVLGVAAAAGLIAVETVAVVLLMELMPKERCESLYLLGVVAISMIWGRWLAVATSVFSALALAYVDDWPILHFSFDLENAVVVGVFLVVALLTNLVANAARARAREAAVLAAQQAALRRVATLVARGARPPQVFAAVAEEMARCLEVDCVEVLRYEVDDSAVIIASYVASAEPHVALGERVALEGDNVAGTVLRTGRAARMDDYDSATGALAARLRKLGVRCRVGAPIVVDEHVWGTAVVGSSRAEPLAADTETQIADFADLVATAIANAATRADLVASRARIVAAADDARRRLERDLHDGAQQRLVSLGIQLRLAEASVPAELQSVTDRLSGIVSGLTAASEELRQISRGIHPAILAKGGLGPALKTLARRCPVPVTLDVAIERRLPEWVEVAAYYVVAEALTNAAKYAQPSEVTVSATVKDAALCLSITDDGIGGADSRNGSGLIGLTDRIEALGGRLQITSPPGSGTSLHATIPLA